MAINPGSQSEFLAKYPNSIITHSEALAIFREELAAEHNIPLTDLHLLSNVEVGAIVMRSELEEPTSI